MTSKLLAVIVRNRLDPSGHGLETFNNGTTDLIRRLTINLGYDCIAAFSLNQRDDGVLVCCTNDDVAVPLTNLGASLNRFGSKSNGVPIRDLASSITTTGIPFAPLFLAA